jgi:hypothetical protein
VGEPATGDAAHAREVAADVEAARPVRDDGLDITSLHDSERGIHFAGRDRDANAGSRRRSEPVEVAAEEDA